MIATVVSAPNKCDYCIAHHTETLNHLVKDRTFVEIRRWLLEEPETKVCSKGVVEGASNTELELDNCSDAGGSSSLRRVLA